MEQNVSRRGRTGSNISSGPFTSWLLKSDVQRGARLILFVEEGKKGCIQVTRFSILISRDMKVLELIHFVIYGGPSITHSSTRMRQCLSKKTSEHSTHLLLSKNFTILPFFSKLFSSATNNQQNKLA